MPTIVTEGGNYALSARMLVEPAACQKALQGTTQPDCTAAPR